LKEFIAMMRPANLSGHMIPMGTCSYPATRHGSPNFESNLLISRMPTHGTRMVASVTLVAFPEVEPL